MTTRFYLDRRGVGDSVAPAPVKISISSKGRTVYLPTNISVLPSQWDDRAQMVTRHPQKSQLNTLLGKRKYDIDNLLYKLQDDGALHGLSATQIKRLLLEQMNPRKDSGLFLPRVEAYASKQEKKSTRETYEVTAKKIRAFSGRCAESLHTKEVTADWLERFDSWMRTNGTPSRNARNVYLRNIRTVYNEAIDDGVADSYPFRKFKIRPEPTKSRALTIPQLRALFAADFGRYQIYADMFRLSFALGGTSFCDLVALTDANIVGGRVEFRRKKTGQFVSVGIQPEARELIDKWRGKTHLVCIAEKYKDVAGFMRRMSARMRHIGQTYNRKTKEWEGEAVAPNLSSYWARYSIATLGAELGHSEDAVGALLGHSANSKVTSIYIRTRRNGQVDSLMRSVLDAVK